jgi:hypothetical protein
MTAVMAAAVMGLWSPSVSMRAMCSSMVALWLLTVFDQLHERTGEGRGMYECDPMTTSAEAGRLVDEPHTGVGEMLERRVDVGNGKGDVVQSFAARGEETADRRVLVQRSQELDERPTDREHRLLDAL